LNWQMMSDSTVARPALFTAPTCPRIMQNKL
jgi:hypothetical protein